MLTRREVLGLMGGLPFARPDQHYEAPSGAIVPGARSVLKVKKLIIVAGAGGGLFAYSGPPAAGNLIASIASAAGNDPYGNAYLAGVAAYRTTAPFFASQLISGSLVFYTAAALSGPWVSGPSVSNSSTGDMFLSTTGAGTVQTSGGAIIGALLTAQSGFNLTGAGTITETALNTTLLSMLVTGDTNPRFIFDTTAAGVARFRLGSGAAIPDINIARSATGVLQVTVTTSPMTLIGGSLDVSTIGQGLQVAEGSNAKQGTATLAAGTVTVANTSVTANSRIFLTAQNSGAAPGALRVSARTAGTSFTISSTSNTDTSLVAYEIFEPG